MIDARPQILFSLAIAALAFSAAAGESIPELLKTVQDNTMSVQERDPAIRTLAETKAGAQALIDLAAKDDLPEELKPSAQYALAISTDADVRKLGQEKLPMPKTKDGKDFPAIKDLLEMKGDAKNGEKVYNDPKGANCAACHIMGDKGRDIGPPLNTIGEKGKDILFESILLPSVAIQHGFHSIAVRTKSSGVKMGILVEDTDEKVTIKDSNGEFVDIPAADIAKKIEQKMSLMPQGLVSTMTLQELIDLIEYLSQQKVQ